MKQAVVAMSGGVDSSVAAYLVREAGYEVTGATMRLYDNETIGIPSEKTCCSIESWNDACDVANRLGIGYIIYDMRGEFRKEVMDRFVCAYENGQTPNPCIDCNRYLKFESLYKLSVKDLETVGAVVDGSKAASEAADGADCSGDSKCNVPSTDKVMIATGHYARIEYDEESGRYMMRKAVDLSKDQTYVLYNMTQEQLSRTLFPLGELTKPEVRKIAESMSFATAHKKESQDICFVPDGDYGAFIEGYTGRTYPPGDFVDEEGNVMGTHKGIINYTIGQRKGLGLALKKPAYVQKIDTVNNCVVLGDNEHLFKKELYADDFNWLSIAEPAEEIRGLARIRYKHHEAPATITPLDPDSETGKPRVKIVFDEPQRAITSGQSVVVYGGENGDYVLGGGIIR